VPCDVDNSASVVNIVNMDNWVVGKRRSELCLSLREFLFQKTGGKNWEG
jgi:hypothetical protein